MRANIYTTNLKNGNLGLLLSIICCKLRFNTSLGSVHPTDWDCINAHITGKKTKPTAKASAVIALYDKIRTEIRKYEIGVESGFIEQCTTESIKKIVNDCKGRKTTTYRTQLKTLFVQWCEYGSKRRNTSISTINQRSVVLSVLEELNLPLDKLSTLKGLERLESFLVNKHYSNSTVRLYMSITKTMLTYGARNGICDGDFLKYKCELKQPTVKEKAVIYLTPDEVQRFKDVETAGTKKDVQRIFLFQCYTGLRVSDVLDLTWQDIRHGHIVKTMIKTGEMINNRLPNDAMQLLDEIRATETLHNFGNTIFRSYALNCIERNIRLIAETAQINEPIKITTYRDGKRQQTTLPKWQLLSSHAGRKSFVVNALSIGATANQVIKYTGHSTIQAMQPYIDITDTAKDNLITALDNARNNKINEITEQIKLLQDELKRLSTI